MERTPLSFYALAQINSVLNLDGSNLPHKYQVDSTPRVLVAKHDPRVSSSINTQGCEEPVPITSKVVHKFYEPVILLVSLIDAVKPRSVTSSVTETLSSSRDSDLQSFKVFVNKLAHVCSSSKGGQTVTSFIVLREPAKGKGSPSRVHYLFAANQETLDELNDTKAYVQNLLSKVGKAASIKTAEGSDTVRKDLHHDVLVFNRRRISSYLREIQEEITNCLERCATDDGNESQLLSSQLKPLVDSTNSGASLKARETEYISKVQTTIRLLLQHEKSAAYPILVRRAEEGRLISGSSQECFSNFLHTCKRILAYPQSVSYILNVAKTKWAELFDSPIVSFLPSSRPLPRPYREKSLKAESIVGRMTRKEKQMAIFKDFVKRLQVYDLDERILAEYDKKSFSPVVHAEVLLLNHVWTTYGGATNGSIDPSVFFNGWMYIGSSKPTCRLCHYYFEERRSGVEHRDEHGNLYPAWAFPEVFPSQGQTAIDDRQIMIDRVLQRVRKDAFDVVRKKIAPRYKEADSNTFSEGVTLEERWTIQPSVMDEITSMMGEMNTEDDDGDDDGGGALL